MSDEHGPPVIVLGMHRSGTSLLTRVINLCGVRADPESEMMPASWENPRGYWEPEYLADLNDALFEFVGSAWYAPRAFALHELELPPSFRARLASRVEERDAEPTSFLWKDPRLSLTWPLWRPLLAPPVVLICMRNPASVAASLWARNGFPREVSYALWELYVQFGVAYVCGERHTVVHYEQLMAEPQSTIERLLEWLTAMGVVFETAPLLDEACAECVPAYDRQHRQPDELELDPLAEAEQKALYRTLLQTSIGEQPAVTFDADRLGAQEDKVVPLRTSLEERWWRKRSEHWQADLLDEMRAISKSVAAIERAVKKLSYAERSRRMQGRRRRRLA